jgi:hypothetical protein
VLTCATGLSRVEYRNPGQLNWEEKKAEGAFQKKVVRSNRQGEVTLHAFLKNRSYLVLRPAAAREFWVAKIKFWVLGTLILGLAAFQLYQWNGKNPPGTEANKNEL